MSDIISPSKAGIADVGFSTTQSDSLVFSPQWRTQKNIQHIYELFAKSRVRRPNIYIYINIYILIYISSISGLCLGKNPSKFISLRILWSPLIGIEELHSQPTWWLVWVWRKFGLLILNNWVPRNWFVDTIGLLGTVPPEFHSREDHNDQEDPKSTVSLLTINNPIYGSVSFNPHNWHLKLDWLNMFK
jgi:hypothetical protein